MIGSDELLRAYAQLILRVSGAATVSVYVPAGANGLASPFLIHEGELPALPELADLASAGQLCSGADIGPKPVSPSSLGSFDRVKSANDQGCLIRIPTFESILLSRASVEPKVERRARSSRSRPIPSAWLGLRFAKSTGRRTQLCDTLDSASGPDPRGGPPSSWIWLLAAGGALAWHNQRISSVLREPVSQLPGRTMLESTLRQAMERLGKGADPVALILINPDDFGTINESFGRETGDTAIREVAQRLGANLRQTDFVCRYGGAIFGVVLERLSFSQVSAVATKLHRTLTERAYLDGAARFSFSLGVASHKPVSGEDPEEAKLELIRRADRALNAAKLAGGGRVVTWKADTNLDSIDQLDRLSGIFTANLTKDYRNMLLLWDAVGAVTSHGEFEPLVGEVLDKLVVAFGLDRAGLFSEGEQGALRLVKGVSLDGGEAGQKVLSLDDARSALLEKARRAGGPEECSLPPIEGDAGRVRTGFAVPMMAADNCLGCLYLEGSRDKLKLDSSDLIFLKALAGQLVVALDRARLLEQERARQEREQRGLRNELKQLRRALNSTTLVHRSTAMEKLLASVRRAAPTDATILIHGESGVGKELIAHTIHELSARRRKRLVIVDCSAIATSLIDSELFGHEKGAYTGADQRSGGRLVEADGGTVLLDEIGELPLEVQSKLLRFVQEKRFTPVGSGRSRGVDTRIIAATNRDLAADVEAGRFREDLYHRLNVVHLEVPPLRDRRDDIHLLARHYLERFTALYQKKIGGFTREAETLLLEHDWPGNVRELQNRIMRAVILCEEEELTPQDLDLDVGPGARDEKRPAGVVIEHPRWSPEEAWSGLRAALVRQIETALEGKPVRPVPLGKWVMEDLVSEAFDAANGVFLRGATVLGIPDTTYRRRLSKATAQSEAGLSPRPPGWGEVRSCIVGLLATNNPSGTDLLKRAREILLEEVIARLPERTSLGAAFMGVTEPTFRRWAAELTRTAAAS